MKTHTNFQSGTPRDRVTCIL